MNVVLTGSDVDIAQKALEMYIALRRCGDPADYTDLSEYGGDS